MSRMRRESALLTVASMSRCRFLFEVLEVRMWRFNARLRFANPPADTLNRLAARRGGRGRLAGSFLRRQDHVEKRPFLARLGLHHAVLGDFAFEAAENPVADVPVHVLPAAEDHGRLHLLPL